MIVWGTSFTNKVVATGQFYCPGCMQHRTYRLRRPKKWGCIYWIPLFPLQEFEPYVECTSCNGSYPETALRQDAASAQQQLHAQSERERDLSRMLCEVMSLMAGEKIDVTCLRLGRSQFTKLLRSEPAIAIRLLQVISARLRALQSAA